MYKSEKLLKHYTKSGSRMREPNVRKQTIYNRRMDDNSQFMNCVKCVYIIFMCEIKKITEISRSGISVLINLYEIYVSRDFFCCDYEEVFFCMFTIVWEAYIRISFDFKTKHSRLRNSLNFSFPFNVIMRLWM